MYHTSQLMFVTAIMQSFCSNVQISHYRCLIIKYVSIHMFSLHFGDCLPQNHSISCVSKILRMTYIYIQTAQPSTGGSRSKGGSQVVLQRDNVWGARQRGQMKQQEIERLVSCFKLTVNTAFNSQHDLDGSLILMMWLLCPWKSLCFHLRRFVYNSRITRKLMNGFPLNSIIQK